MHGFAYRVHIGIINSLYMGNLRCLDSSMGELGELIKTQREHSEWSLMCFLFMERCSDMAVPGFWSSQWVRDVNLSGKKKFGKTALAVKCYCEGTFLWP